MAIEEIRWLLVQLLVDIGSERITGRTGEYENLAIPEPYSYNLGRGRRKR